MITNDEAKRNLAANLKRLMGYRGWTQSELAREIGATRSSICSIVNGQQIPSVARVARLAEVLDTSIDLLLSPPPERKSKNSP